MKGMKKIFRRILIIILVLLLLSALFIAAWIFLIVPHFVSTENKAAESRPGLIEVAEESEKIDFNESNGVAYVNNEIVVFIKAFAAQEEIDALFDGMDAEADDTMADIYVYKLIFKKAKTYDELESLIKKLKKNEIVENAYLNTVAEFDADATDEEDDFDYKDPFYPDDPWNDASWEVTVPGGENWGMEAIDAPGAWGYLEGLDTTRIGLIDFMPDTSHEDLSVSRCSLLFIDESTGKTAVNKYSISADDHGTHVSGIMNAGWNNGTGVSGVMGGKGDLYYCAVFYDSGGNISAKYATAYSYLLALKTLIDQDVRVINISQNTNRLIGFAASHGNQNAINYLTQQADLTEKGLLRVIAAREAEGKTDFVICVAAGNNNNTCYYPDDDEVYGYREKMTWWENIKHVFGWQGEKGDSLALYNNFLNLMDADDVKNRVIVVGAVGIDPDASTSNGTRYSYADFSNVGSRVDIAAPGVEVYSCTVNGYDSYDGTSMATPHVSGGAGLIFSCNPSLSGPEVKSILLASVTGRFYYTGGYCGLLNVNSSVVNALKTMEASVEKVLKTETDDGLDLCFVVDTTGSMGDDIENAKENMESILEHLAGKTENYRVALIDYRDYSSRSGDSSDYPYKVRLNFDSNNETIVTAINGLDLGNGGDNKETVYSALMAAVNLDWRSGAKKVIIILGDAAPLDPEPVTDYIYEDVLLALFNADISLDYEASDDRVVDALDASLINVFSIGTDASADAADFFKRISEGTGGSYAGVDDASKVSDAIIGSIEQIEVAERVTVKVDFGDEMADQKISLYSGKEFLFTFETDDRGQFTIDSIEPDVYEWTSSSLQAGGSIDIDSKGQEAIVRTTETYWFAPMLQIWHQYAQKLSLALLFYLAACIALPLLVKYIRRRILQRRAFRLAEADGVSPEPGKDIDLFCPNCGSETISGAKFCERCGYNLHPDAERTERRM